MRILLRSKASTAVREADSSLEHLVLLRVSLCRHLNIAIRCFRVLVNREEMVLNLFEHGGIVIDHTAVAADFHWRIGNQQILPLMAIEIVDPPFLILVTATEITGHGSH